MNIISIFIKLLEAESIKKCQLDKEEQDELNARVGSYGDAGLGALFLNDVDYLGNFVHRKEYRIYELLSQEEIPFEALSLDLYKQLLPLTKLAYRYEFYHSKDLEGVELREAELYAAKLAIAFGNKKDIIIYLRRIENAHIGDKYAQLIHDACLFSLPRGGKWNLKLWQSLAAQHMGVNKKFERALAQAPKIEAFIAKSENYCKIEELFSKRLQHEEQKRKALHHKKLDQKQAKQLIISGETKVKFEKQLMYAFEQWARNELGYSTDALTQEKRKSLAQKMRDSGAKKEEIRQTLAQQKAQEQNVKKKSSKNFLAQSAQEGDSEELKVTVENLNITQQNELPKNLQARDLESSGSLFGFIKEGDHWVLSDAGEPALLFSLAEMAGFDRGAENPALASAFLQQGLTEASFNRALSLIPQDDFSQIPDVSIDGEEIGYSGFSLERCSSFIPDMKYLGKFTSCCQFMGHPQGEFITVYGIESKYAGAYVLKNAQNGIVAQCLAWRGKDQAICFDSVEININLRKSPEKRGMVSDFYCVLAATLVCDHGVPRVFVGKGGQTPSILGVELGYIHKTEPVGYEANRDSHTQRLIADAKLPLIDMYVKMRKHGDNSNDATPPAPQKLLDKLEKIASVMRGSLQERDMLDFLRWRAETFPKDWSAKTGSDLKEIQSNKIEKQEKEYEEAMHKKYKEISGYFSERASALGIDVKELKEFYKRNCDYLSKLAYYKDHAKRLQLSSQAIFSELKTLLDQGVDIRLSAKTNNGKTTLVDLMISLKDMDAFQECICLGIKFDYDLLEKLILSEESTEHLIELCEKYFDFKKTLKGGTLLHQPCVWLRPQFVQWLITRQGVDVNHLNWQKRTALFCVATGLCQGLHDFYREAYISTFKLLVQMKSDINLQDYEGKVAWLGLVESIPSVVLNGYSGSAYEVNGNWELLKWCLEHTFVKPNLWVKDKIGNSIISIVDEQGKWSYLYWMIKHSKLDLNQKDDKGHSFGDHIIHRSVSYALDNTMLSLAELGLDLTQVRDYDGTLMLSKITSPSTIHKLISTFRISPEFFDVASKDKLLSWQYPPMIDAADRVEHSSEETAVSLNSSKKVMKTFGQKTII